MSTALDSIIADSGGRIRTVLFDWGGTLAKYLGNIPQEKVFRAAHDTVPERHAERFADAVTARVDESWLAGSTTVDTIESLTLEVIAAFDVPDLTEEVGHRFVANYLSTLAAAVHHRGEAKPVLAQLNRYGYNTAMVCNTIWPAAWHDRLLERDDLLSALPVRAYSSQSYVRKPHPDAFRVATDELRVDPRACVYVGDRGDEDIDGAAAVGMATIWVRNSYSPPCRYQPDASVDSLCQLVGK